MGIYSTEAAQIYRENIYNPDASGLLEFALESQRSEQAMFNAMLEMDFLEYRTESGDILLTETEKNSGFGAAIKGTIDKIAKLIEKAIETVSAFIKRIGEFVLEKTKADKLFIKKYSKDFDIEKAINNDPDKEVTLVDIDKASKAINFTVGELNQDYASVAIAASGRVGDSESLSGKLDKFKKNVDTLLKRKDLEETHKLKDLKDKAANIKSAVEGGNYKSIANDIITDESSKVLDTLKKLRKEFKPGDITQKEDESKEDFKDRRALAAEQYRFVGTLNSLCSKTLNFGSRIALQAMADYRKAYVAIAIAASKKTEKSEEKPTTTNSSSTSESRPETIVQRQAREQRAKVKAKSNINKAHSGYADTGASSYADFETESAIYTDILEFAIKFNTDNAFSVSFG